MELQKIHILDDTVINQIAAGEVVERPSSVLKEILENSADSGATRIEIDILQGGKGLIQVVDDGVGMSVSDLKMSVVRHATSKIKGFDDLLTLQTLGFRGEALASIGSVAKLSIRTSEKNVSVGHQVDVEYGRVQEVVPTPPVEGTSVEVRDLFLEVPARLKFLKSDSAELGQLKKVVRGFALSSPHIEILFRSERKAAFHFAREDFFGRARQVLALKESELIPFGGQGSDISATDLKVQGLAARPEKNAPTLQNTWFIVNGRVVQDKTLQAALIESYRGLIMHHQYPQAVVKVDLPNSEVDFNVHPSKAQVRFKDQSSVFRVVSKTIRAALEASLRESQLNQSDSNAPIERQENFVSGEVSSERLGTPSQPFLFSDNQVQYRTKVHSATPLEFTANAGYASTSTEWISSPNPTVNELKKVGEGIGLQIIGQFAETYIVCQAARGLVLIDQHAAHERVLFERIKKSFQEKNFAVQAMLFTERIEADREVVELLETPGTLELLKDLGFEVSVIGETSIGINSCPEFLTETSLKPLFEKLFEDIKESRDLKTLRDEIDHLFATMACHGAIRAGRAMSRLEMESLLTQMGESVFSQFCPHGRPVQVAMTLSEIEKQFKRIL